MFEESKLPRYVAAAVLAAGALWLGTYIVRSAQNAADSRAAEKALDQLAKGAATATGTASQVLMQPVHDATIEALNNINRNFQQKEAERKAKLTSDREAQKPKAYRWKDKHGAWHLSDTAPAMHVAVEIIPLEDLRR